MTQKEKKQLLLIDLCARLPYGIKVKNVKSNFDINTFDHNVEEIKFLIEEYDIKPYLRPMSSMTEEEEREYNGLLKPLGDFMFEQEEEFKPIQSYKSIPFELYDFFIDHHLDFRGLIPMGLALEAKKEMYKTE